MQGSLGCWREHQGLGYLEIHYVGEYGYRRKIFTFRCYTLARKLTEMTLEPIANSDTVDNTVTNHPYY